MWLSDSKFLNINITLILKSYLGKKMENLQLQDLFLKL